MNLQNQNVEILQRDLEIPEMVQKRINMTLDGISGNVQKKRKVKYYGSYQKAFRVAAACAVIGILGVGGTVGASTLWSHASEKLFGIEKDREPELTEKKVLTNYNTKAVSGGLMVEAEKVIASGKYARVLLKTTVPKNMEIDKESVMYFKDIEVLANGKSCVETTGEDIATDWESGEKMIHAEDGVYYTAFTMTLREDILENNKVAGKNDKLDWDGQDMDITLKNFQKEERGEAEDAVNGEWTLHLKINASQQEKTYTVNKKLANGAMLKSVILMPVGVSYCYDAKSFIKTEAASEKETDERGKETQAVRYGSPEPSKKYEMSDGTVKELIACGGGVSLPNQNDYVWEFPTRNLLDVENIAAVYIGDERVELK